MTAAPADRPCQPPSAMHGTAGPDRPTQRLVHRVARPLMRCRKHDETHGRRHAQRQTNLPRAVVERSQPGEHGHDDGVTGQQVDRQLVGEPTLR